MFTVEQIKVAHSKVKSGADFPTYMPLVNRTKRREQAATLTDDNEQ